MEFASSQRRAIEAPLGPVLVVAGPGAGKTFCLIERVRHLVTGHGIAPERICAVTFTNRAAEEIAQRLHVALARRADAIRRGTIHALCLTLLRQHADAAGLRQGFGVADEQYQHVILARLRVPAERRGGMLTRFGRHRFQGYALAADEARIYREYAAWLAHRGMLDFDDLIVRTEQLLRSNGEIAAAIAARWDYLLVDEFQDVNAVQYDLLKRLAAPHGNFFAVGDDEQSIFTWTGADPYVLVRFQRDYEAEPVILDKNRRCSRQIFETARRVLAQNPQLFRKQLSAERESPHDVLAHAFRDEEEEASWLLEDIGAERDVAILYRKHRVGELLEGRLLNAGIPCRLARGRSLIEDDVIRYVISALRVVRSPDDPVALDGFARCVLSEHFFQEVQAAIGAAADFIGAVRTLARRRPKGDPDTKKLWRLVYQVENLRALPRSHPTLRAVITEILSHGAGAFRNTLEEHHDELSDPATLPEAVALAARLEAGEEIGTDNIGLRGLLIAAGIRGGGPPGSAAPNALMLFKALQLIHSRDMDQPLDRYVAFDFETTDTNVATCGVVEIGAVRVVNGEIVDRFHSLVNPYQPISPKATEVHGYSDADVAGAPPFHAAFTQFLAFVGADVLIAHNGQKFDIPVLKRLAAGIEGVDRLAFYDTLLLVRSLSQDSAKQEDIAHRMGIDCGRAHHALDDAVTLAKIYRELEKQRAVKARKAVLSNLLDYLGLALALEREQGAGSGEHEILFNLARFRTLGRYSDALEFYATERARTGAQSPPLDEVIRRLGGQKLMDKLRAEPDPAERYPSAVARLGALTADTGQLPLSDAIDCLLDRVALSASDSDVAPDRVNLLTLHSTKGLEFSRVYIVGVEDYEIPGWQATTNNIKDEIEEARRLLYVGMTRARERLVLTRVERRFGRDSGGSMLLEEMGLLAVSGQPSAVG